MNKIIARVVGTLVLICVGVAVVVWMLERVPTLDMWFFDDNDHPNARVIEEAYAASRIANQKQLNLSRVDGGRWTLVCLVGGYQTPVSVISTEAHKRGIAVSRLSMVWSWFWVGDVPEESVALAVVSPSETLRVYRLRVPDKHKGYVEHLESCATPDRPLVDFKE